MKKVLFALIGVLSLGSVAVAADLPVYKAPNTARVNSLFDWGGFYGGVHLGYKSANTNGSIGPLSYSPDGDGFIYGGQIGVQKHFGNNVVLGVQMDISKSDVDGSSGVTGAPGVTAKHSFQYLGTAEGKIGLAMDRWLPHVTAGAACARGKGQISTGGGSITSNSYDSCGWTVGAGVDWAIADNAFVTVKYQYLDLGSSNVSFPVGPIGISVPADSTAHVVKLGLNIKH